MTTSDRDSFVYPFDPSFPTTYGVTPSQTVGPFLHIGLPWEDGPDVVPPETEGLIRIVGAVYDGAGEPIRDALVETWQADPEGHFDHPLDRTGGVPSVTGFRGFGRSDTSSGEFEIRTVKPGAVPAEDGSVQAPHVDVSVFARGMLNRVVTRLYFPDEAHANASDPVLQSVPDDRRPTLIAVAEGSGLRFDVHLQGDRETVFFEL